MIQGIVHFQNASELPKIGPVAFNVIVILHGLNEYSTDGIFNLDCLGEMVNLSRDIARVSSLGPGEKD